MKLAIIFLLCIWKLYQISGYFGLILCLILDELIIWLPRLWIFNISITFLLWTLLGQCFIWRNFPACYYAFRSDDKLCYYKVVFVSTVIFHIRCAVKSRWFWLNLVPFRMRSVAESARATSYLNTWVYCVKWAEHTSPHCSHIVSNLKFSCVLGIIVGFWREGNEMENLMV